LVVQSTIAALERHRQERVKAKAMKRKFCCVGLGY